MTIPTPHTDALPLDDAIERIVSLNDGLNTFWSGAQGWAPLEAANLLTKSRLDRQVSLSRLLNNWAETPISGYEDGVQILGYSNLGSLVEGSLKLFLSVYYDNYKMDPAAFHKKGKLQDLDVVTLEPLRQYFAKNIWDTKDPADGWDAWISRIQFRRNSIHAFKHREIGNLADLHADIRAYLKFLRRINNSLPYPAVVYTPLETKNAYGELEAEVAASAG